MCVASVPSVDWQSDLRPMGVRVRLRLHMCVYVCHIARTVWVWQSYFQQQLHKRSSNNILDFT